MRLHQLPAAKRGFSLTELSASIAIIAVIAGSAISVAITNDSSSKIQLTNDRLDAIEDALGAFIAIEKRLPCPADPEWSGLEFAVESASGDPLVCNGTGGFDITGTNGTIRYGALPALDLQLPADYYNDGWDRPFTYVVDTRFANSTTTNTTPCDGTGAEDDDEQNCFLYADAGDIQVDDVTGTERTAEAVVYVFSHGINGHGAFFANGSAGRFAANDGRVRSAIGNSSDEWENVHMETDGTVTGLNEVFVQRLFIKGEGRTDEVFDDIGRYLTRSQLVQETGATLFQEECAIAQAVLESSESNDCSDASNESVCVSFANEVSNLCLN